MPPKVHESALRMIGNTPLVRLARLPGEEAADVLVKLEYMNPGGSVKDRICLSMIEDAEQRGVLKPGMTVVESTSGNTGIGLALVCAVKGYKLILTMPDTMSVERRKMLRAYGAELVLTPDHNGMGAAVEKAKEIIASGKGYYLPDQFGNPANPEAHRKGTGPEILEQVSGAIDAFVAGVGTGGTITGVGQALREKFGKKVTIVAVEPTESAVLSGGEPATHAIQGIVAGFVPAALDTSIYDRIAKVSAPEAYEMSRRLAREEGILAGVSTGANVHAAVSLARELGAGKTIVTVAPSAGERYLSTGLFDAAAE